MGLRGFAEKLSRRVVLARRLPSDLGRGTIYVAPQSGGLKMWRRDIRRMDPTLLRLATEFVKAGSNVWDIGANMGLFTFSAANRAGPAGSVLCIEPDIDNVRLLLRSRAKMNRNANAAVEILPAAISAPGKRISKFMIAARCRASNSLEGFGESQTGGALESRLVTTYTADELLEWFAAPDFVKIDVEGAEVSLLAGAEKLLTQVRPTIAIEVDPSHSRDVAGVFARHRYRMYNADQPAPRALLIEAAWNTLAVPD